VHNVLFGKSSTDLREAPKHMILPIMLLVLSIVAGGLVPQLFTAPLSNSSALPVTLTFKGIAETLMLAIIAIPVYWTAQKILKTKSFRLYDIDYLYELITKEILLFSKNPICVASSWIDFFRSFICFVLARLFKLNPEQNLLATVRLTENARQKRTQVFVNPASIDLLTLGSSLFLTALVVMIFLLFMLFRKI